MEGVCAWLAGVCVLCVLFVSADRSLEAGDHAHLEHQHTHLVSTSNAASGRKYSRFVCFLRYKMRETQNKTFFYLLKLHFFLLFIMSSLGQNAGF